jgi:hypothetical protein
VVVRPLCMCDEEHGLVEARYLDQVIRRFDTVPESVVGAEPRRGRGVRPDANLLARECRSWSVYPEDGQAGIAPPTAERR